MAKYRATARTFVKIDGGWMLIDPNKPGTADFEMDKAVPPSRTWMPLDEEAIAAFAKEFPDSVHDGVVTTPLGPIDLLPKKIDPKDAIIKDERKAG